MAHRTDILRAKRIDEMVPSKSSSLTRQRWTGIAKNGER